MSDTSSNPFERGFISGADNIAKTEGSDYVTRYPFFSIKEGEIAYLQFVTDVHEWQKASMHNMVPTKPKPSWWGDTPWPSQISAVCRRTLMQDGKPLYDDCYIDDFVQINGRPAKATGRTWAIAILREEVIGDGTPQLGGDAYRGRRYGFRNKTCKWATFGDDNKMIGEPETRPAFVVISKAWKNFFGGIRSAANVNGGTVANLTFAIERVGDGLDTDYPATSLGASPQDFGRAEYLKRIGIDVAADPSQPGGIRKLWPEELNLAKMLQYRVSEEYYALFVDPRVQAPPSNRKMAHQEDMAPVRSVPSIQDDELQRMRERIQGYASSASDVASAVVPPAAPAVAPVPIEPPISSSPPVPAQAVPVAIQGMSEVDTMVEPVGSGSGMADLD